MKLELKHLAAYLPYNLAVLIEYGHSKSISNLTKNGIDKNILYCLSENKLKILDLRPLSDITKEIEVNGEKFVPLLELFKLINDYHLVDFNIDFSNSNISYQIDDDWNNVMTIEYLGLEFGYDQIERRFHLMHDWNVYDFNYVEMHDKLLEWHFDIFGLIENNLAIEIEY